MTIGELIWKVIEWACEFWPLRRVNQWEQGVLVKSGKITKTCRTGWHLIIPFLHELNIDDCNVEADLLPRLDVTSRDELTVSLQPAVSYEIFDAALLWKYLHDHEDSVVAVICGEIGVAATTLRYEGFADSLAAEAKFHSNRLLEPWGVRVTSLKMAGFTQTKALRLIGGIE